MSSLNYINLAKSVPSTEFSNVVYSKIKDGKNIFPYESLRSSGKIKTKQHMLYIQKMRILDVTRIEIITQITTEVKI